MKNPTIDAIISEVKIALEKYSSDNIDVIKELNENNETVLYVVYHSRHNSFPVSDKTYPFENNRRSRT